MADPLRNDSNETSLPLEGPALDEQSIDELLAGIPADRQLPSAQNERLNRTAESIGSALGTTVGKMRNGLSLVYDRQVDATRRASEIFSQKAESLTAAVQEKTEELGDMAELKASELTVVAQQRIEQLRRLARQRIVELRHRAAVMQQDHPLELIATLAGTAFVVGIALRVLRSNHD